MEEEASGGVGEDARGLKRKQEDGRGSERKQEDIRGYKSVGADSPALVADGRHEAMPLMGCGFLFC